MSLIQEATIDNHNNNNNNNNNSLLLLLVRLVYQDIYSSKGQPQMKHIHQSHTIPYKEVEWDVWWNTQISVRDNSVHQYYTIITTMLTSIPNSFGGIKNKNFLSP